MIEIKIDINKKDLRELKKMPTQYKRAAERGFTKAVLFLEGKAKKEFTKKRVPQGPLHVRTGTLRRSIVGKAHGLTGYLGDNVIYAATHEYGATIKPKRGKYLKFKTDRGWTSVKSVTIPKRPFILPTIQEHQEDVLNIIEKEIIEELNR